MTLEQQIQELKQLNANYALLIGGLMGIMARHGIHLSDVDKELFGKIMDTFYKKNPDQAKL